MTGLVALAFVAAGTAWVFRLYHGGHDHSRLLALVSVAVGLAALNLVGLGRLVRSVGVPVVEIAHLLGWFLGPFAFIGAAGYGAYRLARRWWNAYPQLGAAARTFRVLGSLAAGLAVAVLVRAAPWISAAAGIAEDATAAGVSAAAHRVLDRVGGALGLT